MFILTTIFLIAAVIMAMASFAAPIQVRSYLCMACAGSAALGILTFVGAGIVTVPATNIGIITSFGEIEPGSLNSGLHIIKPWQNVTHIYLGQQTMTVRNSEAGSRDLQRVHADLVANYTVADGRSLYAVNTTLTYPDLIVTPAIQEVFKAVVARYTAEELVTKRQEVSVAISAALEERLHPYFLKVQVVNLINFGFSQSFDAAIEQKVTASQQAETAKRNLERVQYEAQARVETAKGEAEAIRIQSEAVQQNGGDAYLRLQAITKWDGKMPDYVGNGAEMPFIGLRNAAK